MSSNLTLGALLCIYIGTEEHREAGVSRMSKLVWSAAGFTTPGSDTSPDELPNHVKGTPLADGRAEVDSCFFPDGLNVREWWVNWILDGAHRKRPVAPWKNGHAFPAKWKGSLSADERPETDVETATRWAEFDLDDAGLALPDDARSDELGIGLILPNERPEREECVTLIDWDDVVDEDGNIPPVAAYYIIKYGGFVELSQSGVIEAQPAVAKRPTDRAETKVLREGILRYGLLCGIRFPTDTRHGSRS